MNIAGGIRILEPAIDLGIALAVVSSFKNRVIDSGLIAMGEVGLSGEVRGISMIQARVQEAKKLGFTTCMVPSVCAQSLKEITGIRVIGVKNIAEAVAVL